MRSQREYYRLLQSNFVVVLRVMGAFKLYTHCRIERPEKGLLIQLGVALSTARGVGYGFHGIINRYSTQSIVLYRHLYRNFFRLTFACACENVCVRTPSEKYHLSTAARTGIFFFPFLFSSFVHYFGFQ